MLKFKNILSSFTFDKYDIKEKLNQIYIYSKNISIKSYEDLEELNFAIETLEKLLYAPNSMIKTFIDDPNNTDRFYDIKHIIHNLKLQRNKYLKTLFSNAPVESLENIENAKKEKVQSLDIQKNDIKIEELEEKEEESNDLENESKNFLDFHEILVFSNERIKVFIKKKFYLEVEFLREDLREDLSVLSLISQILFDVVKADGTNIVENFLERKVLIIPRYLDDNLLVIEKNKFKFDEKLLNDLREEISCILNLHHTHENKNIEVEDVDVKSVSSNEVLEEEKNQELGLDKIDYDIEIDKLKKEKKISKEDLIYEHNDELDNLISTIGEFDGLEKIEENKIEDIKKEEEKIESFKTQINHPNKKIDLNEFNSYNQDDIKIEKFEDDLDSKDVKILEKNEEKNIEKIEENKIQQVPLEKKEEPKKLEENIIYEDDKIFCYINKKSKVLGEIVLKLKNLKIFEEADPSDLTYLFLFSKILSSTLFDVLKPEGTNIIYNYKDNKIRIIPRVSSDELNINWNSKLEEVSVLDNVKNLILEAFEKYKNLENKKIDEKIEKKEILNDTENPKKEERVEIENKNIEKPEIEVLENEKEDKAKYLIKNLSKLP